MDGRNLLLHFGIYLYNLKRATKLNNVEHNIQDELDVIADPLLSSSSLGSVASVGSEDSVGPVDSVGSVDSVGGKVGNIKQSAILIKKYIGAKHCYSRSL